MVGPAWTGRTTGAGRVVIGIGFGGVEWEAISFTSESPDTVFLVYPHWAKVASGFWMSATGEVWFSTTEQAFPNTLPSQPVPSHITAILDRHAWRLNDPLSWKHGVADISGMRHRAAVVIDDKVGP
jgi:hypothetical protein